MVVLSSKTNCRVTCPADEVVNRTVLLPFHKIFFQSHIGYSLMRPNAPSTVKVDPCLDPAAPRQDDSRVTVVRGLQVRLTG